MSCVIVFLGSVNMPNIITFLRIRKRTNADEMKCFNVSFYVGYRSQPLSRTRTEVKFGVSTDSEARCCIALFCRSHKVEGEKD